MWIPLTGVFIALFYYQATSGQDVSFEPQEYAYVIKDQELTFTYIITTGLDKWRVTELFVNDLVTPVIRFAPLPDNPSICRFAAAEPPAIYSYTCNASTGVMTFTIDPVSQSFNGYIVRCRSSFGLTADDIITKESRILVTEPIGNVTIITSQKYILPNTCFNITCQYDIVLNDRSTIFTIRQGSTVVHADTVRLTRSRDVCALNNQHHCKAVGICSCDANGLATHLCYNHTTGETGILNIKCQTAEGNADTDEYVAYSPNTTPLISQSPPDNIINGNKVTLTCSVSGGNPLAVLSWNCTGNYTNNTSGNKASYSVDFTVDKTYNNLICTCSGSHPLSSYRPTLHRRLIVYYAPAIKPTVKQTPKGVIVPGNKVTLTCSVSGGHPLAVLVWDCSSTNTNNTLGNTASYSVEFYTNTTYNNRICTCSATHPVTSYRPLVQHKLAVYFSPQYIQIEEGKGLFTAGISSLVIGVLALVLAIVFISCWLSDSSPKGEEYDYVKV